MAAVLACLTLLVSALPAASIGTVIYVDAAATGTNDGSSWPNAFTDLQAALTVASDGDEIRVAEGTYTPHATDRSLSFDLVEGTTITGGYQTGGTAGPDPGLYETVLSGDLNGDDQPGFVNRSENSCHVVRATGVTAATVLAGLTITAGNADTGPCVESWLWCGTCAVGGGLVNDGSSPTLVDLKIVDNAAHTGGGVLNLYGSPAISNTTISDNRGTTGGGIYNIFASPSIVDSVIDGNHAVETGGGMLNNSSSPSVTGSTATGNTADQWGGFMYSYNSGPSIASTVITGNVANGLAGGIYAGSSSMWITDSVISDNTAARAGGIHTRGSSTEIIGTIISRNTASNGSGGGVENFTASSMFITNSAISDNTASLHGGGILNYAPLTIVNSTIAGNTATAGSGAGLYNTDASPVVVNSTVADNAASSWGGVYSTGSAAMSVANSIVWGNGSLLGILDVNGSATSVSYSDVEGWSGGAANIDADPKFAGPGDYQLQASSPARDAGDNTAVPPDTKDVDGDGDTTEPTPDLALNDRITASAVDMGAYESPAGGGGIVVAPGITTMVEGDNGTTIAHLPITLSAPSPFTVSVDWAANDWSATAPDDYQSASGTLSFAPGETNKSVPVTITADTMYEADEFLAVVLTNPVNATVGGFMGIGLVFIENDDPVPSLSPGGVVIAEGTGGTSFWNMPVTLSEPAGVAVTVDWATLDIPTHPLVAHPASDYVAGSGTLTFMPGETTKNVALEIIGDAVDEPPLLYGEWGFVSFSNPVNTQVTGGLFGLGVFIIIDDDDVASTYQIRTGPLATDPLLHGASFPSSGQIDMPHLIYAAGESIQEGEAAGVDWYIDEVLFRDQDNSSPFRLSNQLQAVPIGTPFAGEGAAGENNQFLLGPGTHHIRADATYAGGVKSYVARFTVAQ